MSLVAHIYVSHSWSLGDSYDKLLRLLKSDEQVSCRLHGIAKDHPIHATSADYELRAEIRKQMMPTQLLMVQAAHYQRLARWVDEEIDVARGGYSHRRRIIVVVPFGAEVQARQIADRVDVLVPWVGTEIVRIVKEQAALPPEPVVPHDLVAQKQGAVVVGGLAVPSVETPSRRPIAVSPGVRGADLRRSVFGTRRASESDSPAGA